MDQEYLRRAIGIGALALFSAISAAPTASADAGQRLTTQSGKFDCAVFANYSGTGPDLKVSIPAGSYAMCAPRVYGDELPGWPTIGLAVVDSQGNFSIQPIEGPPPATGDIVMNYGQTYNFSGWTIAAGQDGTRFTNDRTGHGMFVNFETVYAF
jgi:hypothetical protein